MAVDVREAGEGTYYGGIVAAELAAGARRFGPLRRAPVLPLDRPHAFGPVVAYDSAGDRVVGWVEDTHPDAGEEAETTFGRAIASTGTTPRGGGARSWPGEASRTAAYGWRCSGAEPSTTPRVARRTRCEDN